MYQSFAMGHAMMNALAVLLVCLAAVSAVPVHFPRGKTVVYNYHADVKAGTLEPAPFASHFGLHAHLHVKQDLSDPSLKNAYYVTLTDVKYGLDNGKVESYHVPVGGLHPIVEAAKMIQDPFLVVYDENGKFQGVKLMENESGWSKNIKQAIASMLQLDLSQIHVETPMKPHSFLAKENTIHGTCSVAYNVHAKDQAHPELTKVFMVTKVHDPQSCTHFVQRTFNHLDHESCQVPQEETLTSSSRRVFEIEHQGDELLIKKLVAHGVINYLPFHAKSEAHFILTNQTLVLENVVPVAEEEVAPVNFQPIPLIRDVTFNKPQGNYALHAAEDLTQGRHIVKLDVLIPKLKKMLGEAADYLEENHMEMKQPDWKHGQTINRLLHTMSYMDLGSLEQVYNVIHEAKTPREVTVKNIFLGMVPTVGTTAASLFTKNVIRKHKVSDVTAILMLSKLPMHVKVPSERLLLEMEDLVKLGDSVSVEVRKASILCFSTLIHKTFQHEHTTTVNPLLERYLQHFLDHVKNEPSYQMKMVYMMAIKNVGVVHIIKLLEPIIRGDLMISEKPYHIRVQAVWAIKQVIAHDTVRAHHLLWPILSDVTLHLPLRIAAYDVLVDQVPFNGRMMNLYWLMTQEKNPHMFHYHLTTMKGFAESVDPCMSTVREMAIKLLRFTPDRHLTGPLSTKYFFDYLEPTYGYGDSLKSSLVLDEHTGLPHMGSIEHVMSFDRKPSSQLGVHWMITGLEDVLKDVNVELFGDALDMLTNENVKKVLLQAAQDMPGKQEMHADICLTVNGHVIVANHYDKDSWTKIFDDVKQWKKHITDANVNVQGILYDHLFEMQVPTELGVPAVLANRVPNLLSVKLNTILAEAKIPLNLRLKVDARMWRHGEYVMSVYNPIADVWHSVRRATSRDVVLPIEMSVGYNHETKSIKVSLPRLPVTKYSVAGISTHARNFVTVTEDETDVLKKSCVTCHHHEVITSGVVHKTHPQTVTDSKDTGLQFVIGIHDCESKVTTATIMSEWFKALSSSHKSTMGFKLAHVLLALRQMSIHDVTAPELGNCGILVKAEPSIIYPTSHIDMNVRVNVEDLDHIHDSLHLLSSKKINVRGTLDVKAASTDASIRLWDVNANVDLSQGHFNNNFKIQMTRITPGEKNLKICIDAQKNYPVINVDPLKIGTTKEETSMKMTLTAGHTDEDKCVRDETIVTMTIKGELDEEQRKHMTHDSIHGACVKDTMNPLFETTEGFVPKTWACLHETFLHTTLRKYTVSIAQKNIPHDVLAWIIMFGDYFKTIFLPHIKYTATTVAPSLKMNLHYPVNTHHLDMSVANEGINYEFTDLPLGHPIWTLFMDNTRFSIPFMHKYMNEQTKLCTVYPQVLLTLDNGTIPFVLSDQWTLVSGDHVTMTYAVFVKAIHGNKMAMKVFVGGHELELMPTEGKPVVTVNGNVIEHLEKGVMVPADEPNNYAIKMAIHNDHVIVLSQHVPLIIMTTPHSTTIVLDSKLQGYVTGLCGHMDNTHKEKIPQIYSVAHL